MNKGKFIHPQPEAISYWTGSTHWEREPGIGQPSSGRDENLFKGLTIHGRWWREVLDKLEWEGLTVMVCVLALKLDIRACSPRFRFKELRIEKEVEEGGCYIAFGFDWPSFGPSFASQPPLFADAHFIEWRRTIRSCLIAWRSLRYGIKKLTQRIQTLFIFFRSVLRKHRWLGWSHNLDLDSRVIKDRR